MHSQYAQFAAIPRVLSSRLSYLHYGWLTNIVLYLKSFNRANRSNGRRIKYFLKKKKLALGYTLDYMSIADWLFPNRLFRLVEEPPLPSILSSNFPLVKINVWTTRHGIYYLHVLWQVTDQVIITFRDIKSLQHKVTKFIYIFTHRQPDHQNVNHHRLKVPALL